MSDKIFAQKMNETYLMEVGMKNNAEVVAKRGWESTKTERLTSSRTKLERLNAEQEKLKADLKLKTAEMKMEMDERDALMKEARSIAKLAFPQEQWKELGITDKR
jgi:hypothetical protein